MLVQYVTIKPSSSGFGMYEAIPDLDETYYDADILHGCVGDVYELGTEDLPDWVEDIRGCIHNEPEKVFVVKHGSQISYFGFNSVDEEG